MLWGAAGPVQLAAMHLVVLMLGCSLACEYGACALVYKVSSCRPSWLSLSCVGQGLAQKQEDGAHWLLPWLPWGKLARL